MKTLTLATLATLATLYHGKREHPTLATLATPLRVAGVRVCGTWAAIQIL